MVIAVLAPISTKACVCEGTLMWVLMVIVMIKMSMVIVMIMVVCLHRFNSHFNSYGFLLMNWEMHMFLVNNRTIDWYMNMVWNWLFDDIWNLFHNLYWCWHWNFNWYMNFSLDLILILLLSPDSFVNHIFHNTHMNWIGTIDWVGDMNFGLSDDFIWDMLFYFNGIWSRNMDRIWSIDWNLHFIWNFMNNRIWSRHFHFLDNLLNT